MQSLPRYSLKNEQPQVQYLSAEALGPDSFYYAGVDLSMFRPHDSTAELEISRVLSPDRLRDYLLARSGNTHEALRLYVWNLALAGAFWSPLSMLEVAFRNALSCELNKSFGPAWYDDPAFHALSPSANFYDSVDKAKKRIPKARYPISEGLVIAHLHFGFWTHMLGPKYARSVWPIAKLAFPKYTRRPTVSSLFDEIRVFRNRIAHHQNIYDKKPDEVLSKMRRAAEFCSPVLPEWIQHFSRVEEVLRSGPARPTLF